MTRRRIPLAAALAAAFAGIAVSVSRGWTQGIDEAVLRAMRRDGAPAGPAWLPEAARDVSALAGWPVLALVAAGAALLLARAGRGRQGLRIVAAFAGAFALDLLLKAAFGRPRPEVVSHLAATGTSSFPSGHALMAAACYGTLAALAGRAGAWLAALVALLVGASRVYLGVHYPTDIAGGWSAGGAWAVTLTTLEGGSRGGRGG